MTTVYWSKFNLVKSINTNIFDLKPYPVSSYYINNCGKPQDHSVNFFSCPANKNYTENLFYIKNPLDFDIRINANNTVDSRSPASSLITSIRDFNENSLILDYFISISLFSEKELSVSVMPPFFLNTPANDAHLIPGEFNIGSWIRPLNATYFVKNKDVDFVLKKDDPLFFIKFNTKDKIKFKEFYFTDALTGIVDSAVGLKKFKRNVPMFELYHYFKQQKLDKLVLKEIRKSLID